MKLANLLNHCKLVDTTADGCQLYYPNGVIKMADTVYPETIQAIAIVPYGPHSDRVAICTHQSDEPYTFSPDDDILVVVKQ